MSELRVVDEVLTQIARGYANAEFVAETLFPVAEMSKESGKIPCFGKEAFKQRQTERAIRAASNRIQPDPRSQVDVILVEHDQEYPLDYREIEEDVLPAEINATEVATQSVMLRREALAAALACDPANYASTNKDKLSGNRQFTNPASNPIAVIETGKEAIRTQIGTRPNTMLLGASVYAVLKQHPALLDRIKFSMKGIVTLDLMKEIFEISNIKVGEAVYTDSRGVTRDIWPDSIVLAMVPQNGSTPGTRSYYKPSYGYTFQKKGQPTVDTYMETGGKIKIIRSTNIFTSKIVGADAGYLIEDTNAAAGQNP
jgi:hypothetical protein